MTSLSALFASHWQQRLSELPASAAHPPVAPTLQGVKAFLFDMDGVLFDSMPAHAEAWVSTCRSLGFDISEHDVYMNEGRTAHTTVNFLTQRQFGRDTTPEEVERIYALKCERFNLHPEAPKMAGADEVLQAVKAAQKTRVVVTGSGQASLLERLTTHYPGYFEPQLVVSSNDVQQGKPHPEPYLMGLQKAGNLDPWQAIVVENAPLGVRAAVAAGCFTIAVNTGPIDPTALADEGAQVVLSSMHDLHDLLTQAFSS